MKCSTDLKDTEGFSVDVNLTIGDIIAKFVWNVLNNYIKNDNKNTLNMQHFNKHASYQKFDCCHELFDPCRKLSKGPFFKNDIINTWKKKYKTNPCISIFHLFHYIR